MKKKMEHKCDRMQGGKYFFVRNEETNVSGMFFVDASNQALEVIDECIFCGLDLWL